MISAFKNKELGENSWITKVEDIKDYDLSAKNPAKIKEIIHESPADILEKIMNTQKIIAEGITKLQSLVK